MSNLSSTLEADLYNCNAIKVNFIKQLHIVDSHMVYFIIIAMIVTAVSELQVLIIMNNFIFAMSIFSIVMNTHLGYHSNFYNANLNQLTTSIGITSGKHLIQFNLIVSLSLGGLIIF